MKVTQVDLHIHTLASDGTQTPKELLDEVIKKDIKIFAITDHDTIESIDEMNRIVSSTDRIFIPGVEISTSYKGKEIHLLTYFVDTTNEELQALLKKNQRIRESFSEEIIKHVATIKKAVSFEDYLNYERKPSWGGWKAENYLREIGAIHHLGELFELLATLDKKMTFDPPSQVLPLLKSLGLTVILAHPPAYYGGQKLSEDFLDKMLELGIDGIECFSPYYRDQGQSTYYVDYCIKNNLMISCGSDYHGKFIETRRLGQPSKMLSELNIRKMTERLGMEFK